MAKGNGKTGMILVVTTIIGAGLLGFGFIQLNFDLSFIGFDITGNVTAIAVPEIQEDNQRLLNAIAWVGEGNVIETSQRFAIGETFQLTEPTVITDFEIRVATQDPDVLVSGFIWNSDQSPPLRLAEAPEVYNGTEIGMVLNEISFTFPQAKVLEPTANATACVTAPCDPVPVNYIVGIRVENNLAQSFTYAFNATEAGMPPITAHGAVFDETTLVDTEGEFLDIVPFGILGVNIFHNQQFGQDLMEELEEDLMVNSTATEDEQEEACIAIFPPPPECTGDDPLQPEDCGVAEDLVNGICVCKEGFVSVLAEFETVDEETGTIILAETSECVPDVAPPTPTTPPPPRLEVPPRVDPIVFLGAGGAILVGSLIGIGIRSFRK